MIFPSSVRYFVAIFSVSIPVRTSSLVITRLLIPLIIQACFSETKSSQPVLLGLPVVAPNSCPICLIFSPKSSFSSVGKGPFPTLVV